MTQDRKPRRFTSKTRPFLALGGIAAASFGLSGCSDEPDLQDAQFTSVDECTKAGFPTDLCQQSYSAALLQHQKDAPHFKQLKDCQAEWGANGCTPMWQSGGNVFVPLLAGFVLSRMVQRDYWNHGYVNYYSGGYYGTPIYRSRAGNTVTVSRSNTGTVTRTPVNVNTRSVSASGFGGMGMSRSGGGSWGG